MSESDRSIQIRVGASLDRSVATVFARLREESKKATDQIAGDSRKAARDEQQQRRQALRDQQRQLAEERRARESELRDEVRAKDRAERQKVQAAKRAAREEEKILRNLRRGEKEGMRDAERERKRIDRERMRSYREQVRQRDEIMRNVGHVGRHVLRFAGHVFGDLARGAGVNLDFGSHVEANTEMESVLAATANEGYQPTDPRNNRRIGIGELQRESFGVAEKTGYNANEIARSYQEYVGRTGDLQSAREIMFDLGKIAKATGSNLQDVVGAAADVGNQLGDIPDKGAAISRVMMQIAEEGKKGAIPMRSMATQMSKLAANARMMEGDAGANIGLFGAVAQSSKLQGGSASASQAATSIMSMMSTFSSPARAAAFKRLGIRLSGAGGKYRNIEDLAIESFQKTQKGNDVQASNMAFAALFSNVRAQRALGGFQSIFRTTYAKTQGNDQEKLAAATKAVRDEFTRLSEKMDETELNESFARAMNTSASKAAQFNTAMQEVVQQVQTNVLLPLMQEIAPDLVALARKLKSVLGGGGGAESDAASDAASKALADLGANQEANKAGVIGKAQKAQGLEDEANLKKKIDAHKAAIAKQRADGVSFGDKVGGFGAGFLAGGWGTIASSFGHGLDSPSAFGRALLNITPVGGMIAGYRGIQKGAEVVGTQSDSYQNKLGSEQHQLEREQADLKALHESNKKIADAVQSGAMRVIITADETKGGTRASAPDHHGL